MPEGVTLVTGNGLKAIVMGVEVPSQDPNPTTLTVYCPGSVALNVFPFSLGTIMLFLNHSKRVGTTVDCVFAVNKIVPPRHKSVSGRRVIVGSGF